MRVSACFFFALLVCAVPALANVTVYSPANGWEVVSPFNLSATASPCSSQPIAAMGYSLDNSSNTTIVNAASVNAKVSAPTGAHTLHVKSWGNQGASCVTDVAIVVMPDPTSSVPVDAVVFNSVQALSNWQATNDSATAGSSTGTSQLVASPAISGAARNFTMQFTSGGGERYSVRMGANTTVSNFLYDGWVYLASPSSGIGNLELDMNQVMANGQTVIYGIQCAGWSNTWEYTANTGTPQNPVDTWIHTDKYCNPRSWGTDAWHHVQMSYSRDEYGNVTYKSIWLDGVQEDIYVTAPSAFALGWASSLLTNFQLDGYGTSGSVVAYLDNLTIYAW